MSQVTVVEAPDLSNTRQAFVLREDRLGHYAEFRRWFTKIFDLDRIGMSRPGYLKGPSGMVYAMVFLGRSGEAFPAGLEIFALPEALEPLDDEAVDRDAWAILCWMMDGVGAPWSRADLETTGRIYHAPAASET